MTKPQSRIETLERMASVVGSRPAYVYDLDIFETNIAQAQRLLKFRDPR